MAMIQSINPATDEVIQSYTPHTPAQIDDALANARRAFEGWRTTSFAQRGEILRRVASELRQRKSGLAKLATLEMGKPIAEAEAEIEKCAWGCEFYAEHAERFLAPEVAPSTASESYIAFRPLGVIFAIMPWNYPYWQVLRFAAPALMAGNAAVLKHASNVSGCALAIEEVLTAAGLPDGLFRTLLMSGPDAERLIADPRIAAVTLTGSDAAGSAVAAAAGRALKKTVLELGGSDAFIVLADADLDAAAQIGVRARFQNTGQSCIAAKRFIVVDEVADAFTEKFVHYASQLKEGDPLDPGTQLGPVVNKQQREALQRQVEETVAQGASVVLGGEPASGPGAYYPATVVTGVTPEMPMFRQETFGPAAAIIRAKDTDQAIDLANDSQFGLGGNLWTADIEQGQALAARLDSGGVFINGMTASDPRLPFGGVKRSGYGRELSAFGIREFVNIQTVWIGPAQAAAPTSKPSE